MLDYPIMLHFFLFCIVEQVQKEGKHFWFIEPIPIKDAARKSYPICHSCTIKPQLSCLAACAGGTQTILIEV